MWHLNMAILKVDSKVDNNFIVANTVIDYGLIGGSTNATLRYLVRGTDGSIYWEDVPPDIAANVWYTDPNQ